MGYYYIAKGDRLPKIKADPLRNPDGTACNVTGAVVTFEWSKDGATPGAASTGTCTILNATGGIVEFQFQSNSFPTAGRWNGRFRADWSGVKLSFPNHGAITIDVAEAL